MARFEEFSSTLGSVQKVFLFLDVSDVQDSICFPDTTRLDPKNTAAPGCTQELLLNRSDYLRLDPPPPLWANPMWPSTWMEAFRATPQLFWRLQHHNLMALNLRRSSWTFQPRVFREYGERGLQISLNNLNRLSEIVTQQGAVLTTVLIPWPDQLIHDQPQELLINHWNVWCSKKGANCIDLTDAFIAYAPQDREKIIQDLYFHGDMHWNSLGHQWAGQALITKLNQKSF